MNGRFQKISDGALLDLVFGCYSAFRPERAAVLIFHIERTVRLGLESHQAGEWEVVHGFYDAGKRKWIRGPAGVPLKTWHQINRELEDEGLLQIAKENRKDPIYTPQLAAIRIVIEVWRERSISHGKGGE